MPEGRQRASNMLLFPRYQEGGKLAGVGAIVEEITLNFVSDAPRSPASKVLCLKESLRC